MVSRRNERPEDVFAHVDINHAGGNRGIRSQQYFALYRGLKRGVRGATLLRRKQVTCSSSTLRVINALVCNIVARAGELRRKLTLPPRPGVPRRTRAPAPRARRDPEYAVRARRSPPRR